jgi:hypothetical protein
MIKHMILALLIGASPAFASNYYVDCNYGSNGNPGTIQQFSTGRHDQPAKGLHMVRNPDASFEREQWIVNQNR